MGLAQKLGMWTIGIAMVTTLTLKDRQTVPVLGAVGKIIRDTLGTAMGTAKPAG